jgi:hypothetical protein
MNVAYRRGLAAIAIVVIGILLGFWFTRSPAPEVEEISRAASPGGKWTAKVEMVVYGDHWFVNDARYQVRVVRSDKNEPEVLVYSVLASGPTGLSVKWRGDDDLVIEDSSSALRDAVKQPHPSVRIDYRSG